MPPGELFTGDFGACERLHPGRHQCRPLHRDNVAAETKNYQKVSCRGDCKNRKWLRVKEGFIIVEINWVWNNLGNI